MHGAHELAVAGLTQSGVDAGDPQSAQVALLVAAIAVGVAQCLEDGLASFLDAGLANVKGLRKLQELVLTSTKVTDAGLVHLYDMTQLKKLYLASTQVTDAGSQQLLKRLPKLKVYR